MRKIAALFLVLALAFMVCPPITADAANMPNVTPAMRSSDYWVQKTTNAKAELLSSPQINQLNQRISQSLPNNVFDLANYPASLSRQTLDGYLAAASYPEDQVYVNGQPVYSAYRQRLVQAVNRSGLQDNNPVRYGFTVMRTNIRTFPTLDGVFDSPGDRDFDLFQETVADPAEPVVILHQTADRSFLYIQMRNYRGWVPATHVAVAASRQEWLDYARQPDFLVVTDNLLRVTGSNNSAPILFQMGAKLPLAKADPVQGGYIVKLPERAADGRLVFQTATIPQSSPVHRGFLPYTRENILNQSFRMLGDRYGWGGLHDSVDCSSFIANVYRTMGIELPRNADEQENAAGTTISLAGQSYEQRLATLRNLPPGSTLYMDGHTMLYLGQNNGIPYIIHSLGSYSVNSSGKLQRIRAMEVVVSDLLIKRASGTSFLESLTSVKQFL